MRAVQLVALALGSGTLAWLLTPLAVRLAYRVGALDHPGPRKVHREPIPRLGGLAVLAAVGAILCAGSFRAWPFLDWAPAHLRHGLVLGVLPVLFVSVWDDIRPVRALLKLLAQVAGASVAIAYGFSVPATIHAFGTDIRLGVFAIPLSLLWIVGVTNAFNLVDGLDGLSAGLALISAGSLAGVFLLSGRDGMASAAVVLCGALLGFLPYNVYPARVFLGDAGAAGVGFILACFALKGGSTLSAGFATLLPIFAIGLPVAETVVSFARRLVRKAQGGQGGGVFVADRNHIHHRLLALGLDHRRAVLMLYGAGLLFASSALASVFLSAQKAGLLLVALLVAAFIGIGRLGYDEFAVIRSGVVLRFYETPVLRRSFFVVFVDLVMVASALYCAAVLKLGRFGLGAERGLALTLLAILAPITVASFWSFGLYRGAWRLASLDDFLRATAAVMVTTVVSMTTALVLELPAPAQSLLVIEGLVMLVFVNGSRVSFRALQHGKWKAGKAGQPALIYGAGYGGATAIRELLSNPLPGLRPVGFLDDDPRKAGKIFNGYPVLGTVADLADVLASKPIRALVVATSKIEDENLALASRACAEFGVEVYRLHVGFDRLDAPPRLRVASPLG